MLDDVYDLARFFNTSPTHVKQLPVTIFEEWLQQANRIIERENNNK